MPFLVLGLAIAFLVAAIGVFRLHPFLALILAAVLVGLLSPVPLTDDDRSPGAPARSQAVLALELTTADFGRTAGAVGLVIVLAVIIGQALLESGAADRITRTFITVAGEERAAAAFMGSGYFLSVPVFFDTVFILLVPLARSLHARSGRNYLLYLMAICSGAVITHSLVPPTPGPLIMVETLPGLDLGWAIAIGLIMGLPPAAAGLVYASCLNRSFPVVPAAVGPAPEAPPPAAPPGFALSSLPVLLPVLLISGRTAAGLWSGRLPGWARSLIDFAGNKNFALLAAAFLALGILARSRRMTLKGLRQTLEPAILTAGMIVLITSAGGALGGMLSRIGISQALEELSAETLGQGAPVFILLAWLLAALLKTAQGSGTVSIITASGIMASLLPATPPCHPIYIFAAVGFGSMVFSWMNDSGFWVVSRLGGLSEKETFAGWTMLLLIIALAGLVETLVLSVILPQP